MPYLAIALAGLGHEVATVTHTLSPGSRRGVNCVGQRPGLFVHILGLLVADFLEARGDVEQFLETVSKIGTTLALSVIIVYAILAVLYRSYTLSLAIMLLAFSTYLTTT